MTDSSIIELDITDVAHGGVFIARHDGRVVFVSDAIPGERVRARVTQQKGSFWRADTVEVLSASPHRRDHVWAEAGVERAPSQRPGGAEFGHIDIGHQRELKAKVLTDALRRFGRIDRDVTVTAVDGREDGTRWRTRIGVHQDRNGVIGPYAARSHTVVPVTDFPLATEAVARAAGDSRALSTGRVDLVQPADGRVRFVTEHAGPETIVERVGDREFRLDVAGFWQVHHGAAATLDAAVRAALTGVEIDQDAWHLDLYGGVGLFAATLAELGATRVTSVESEARATDYAGENLAEWVGARAETAKVDRWITALRADGSERERERLSRGVVVLDPPRSGAGTDVVRDLTALAPRAVVYVACDPVALARDTAAFVSAGYEPAAISAFDLFPHSHHLETVATFVR